VQAATLTTSLRIAVEHCAFNTGRANAETQEHESVMREALLIAARTFSS
jgi:hypothetical protein